MKKSIFLIVLTVLGFVSCKSTKNVTNYQQPQNGRVELEIPCKQTGFDDAEYFRATGTSTSPNQQSARDGALKSAKSMIRQKLGGFIQTVVTDYSTSITGQTQVDKIQRAIESESYEVVEKALNDAEQICEKLYEIKNTGNYESWISLQIPKKELITNMENALSKNEELEIYFKRDEFRKFAEEKLKQMKNDQKEAIGK